MIKKKVLVEERKGELTMLIKVENAEGQFVQHEVSEEYMELCFKAAQKIADKAKNADECIGLIEESTSCDVQKSIISSMTLDILKAKLMKKMLIETLMHEFGM